MTRTNRRSRWLPGVALVVLCACGTLAAPPGIVAVAPAKAATPKPKRQVVLVRQPLDFSRPPGFYETYLAPGMSAVVRYERAVTTADYANSWLNGATQDPAATGRVETRAFRALGNGVKRYAIERLENDGFTIPMLGGRRQDVAELPADARGAQLHFGFSSLAPRADVLIPVTAGRVVVSADSRLRLQTTFESAVFGFRLAASVDVPARTAIVGLNLRF